MHKVADVLANIVIGPGTIHRRLIVALFSHIFPRQRHRSHSHIHALIAGVWEEERLVAEGTSVAVISGLTCTVCIGEDVVQFATWHTIAIRTRVIYGFRGHTCRHIISPKEVITLVEPVERVVLGLCCRQNQIHRILDSILECRSRELRNLGSCLLIRRIVVVWSRNQVCEVLLVLFRSHRRVFTTPLIVQSVGFERLGSIRAGGSCCTEVTVEHCYGVVLTRAQLNLDRCQSVGNPNMPRPQNLLILIVYSDNGISASTFTLRHLEADIAIFQLDISNQTELALPQQVSRYRRYLLALRVEFLRTLRDNTCLTITDNRSQETVTVPRYLVVIFIQDMVAISIFHLHLYRVDNVAIRNLEHLNRVLGVIIGSHFVLVQECEVVIALVTLLLENSTDSTRGLEVQCNVVDISGLEEINHLRIFIRVLVYMVRLDDGCIDTRQGVNLELEVSMWLDKRVAEIEVIFQRRTLHRDRIICHLVVLRMVTIVAKHRRTHNRQILSIAPLVHLAELSQLGWQPNFTRGWLITNNHILNLTPHRKTLCTLIGKSRYTNRRTVVAIGEEVGVNRRVEVVTERRTIDIALIIRMDIALVRFRLIVFVPSLSLANVADHNIGLTIKILEVNTNDILCHAITVGVDLFVYTHCIEIRPCRKIGCNRLSVIRREFAVLGIPTNHTGMVEAGGIGNNILALLAPFDKHRVLLIGRKRNRTVVDLLGIVGRRDNGRLEHIRLVPVCEIWRVRFISGEGVLTIEIIIYILVYAQEVRVELLGCNLVDKRTHGEAELLSS